MLALLLESALRLLALGGVVWLGLSLLRVRNPHAQMTAWTMVLLASLSMPVLMRCVTVTIPAGPPPSQLAQIVSASLNLPVEATRSPAGPAQPATAPPAASDPGVIDRRSDAISAAVDWRVVATAIYAAVAGVLLLRLLTGLVLTWRLARAARPLGDDWAGAAGRARERCRRRAGDIRIDHPASPRLCRMELCEAAGRAGTRRLACCAW